MQSRSRAGKGQAAHLEPAPPPWKIAHWRRPLTVLVLFLGFTAGGLFAGVLAVRAPVEARAIESAPVCGAGPSPCLTVRQGRLARRPDLGRSDAPGDSWSVGSFPYHRDEFPATRAASRTLREREGSLVTGLWWHGDLVGVRLDDGRTVLSTDLGWTGLVTLGSMAAGCLSVAAMQASALVGSWRRRRGWWEWIPVPVWSFDGGGPLAYSVAFGFLGGCLGLIVGLWGTWLPLVVVGGGLAGLFVLAGTLRLVVGDGRRRYAR